jgi:biotin/methionine sulfoxide reductase
LRVTRPSVRKSWIEHGWGARPELRGRESFVEVSWDEAIALAADALGCTIASHGNEAVFGGSYGWSSAGRFHHAQSQVHRFLNALGGYVRSVDSYSLGAGRVIMPHVVASMDHLLASHTDWQTLAEHTRLFLTFGGIPRKNTQICQGLAGQHRLDINLQEMVRRGVRFVNVSPVRDDLHVDHEWLSIRPNTDTALLLALCHTLLAQQRADTDFLARYCVGFDIFAAYLRGQTDGVEKDAEWAARITGLQAEKIRRLAEDLASVRSMINVAWSLQRAHHGEQPYWGIVALAAMLGQIGLPGGGFGVGYGTLNGVGGNALKFGGPTLPQGHNPVETFCPVARIADMLESPGKAFSYNGAEYRFPEVRLIYWVGGNPFHHHQDLNRLLVAWRRPQAVIVNEQFWTATAKCADIVFPATTTLERNDIGYGALDRYLVPMRKIVANYGEAKDDFDIFTLLSERLGCKSEFTEGRSTLEWLRWMYEGASEPAAKRGMHLPPFSEFWEGRPLLLPANPRPITMLSRFRDDPEGHPLSTPSGKIELFSARVASFGYADCKGHATWLEPAEWLGSPLAEQYPLHLVSDQPHTKLHSQLDHSDYSVGNKIQDREPLTINVEDALARGIRDGDVVRIFNGRGACLAGARLSSDIRCGVVKLATGAWFDPDDWTSPRLERHGNPNALTADIPSSSLSQGCSAQTCLVQVEAFHGTPPPVEAFRPPSFTSRTDR